MATSKCLDLPLQCAFPDQVDQSKIGHLEAPLQAGPTFGVSRTGSRLQPAASGSPKKTHSAQRPPSLQLVKADFALENKRRISHRKEHTHNPFLVLAPFFFFLALPGLLITHTCLSPPEPPINNSQPTSQLDFRNLFFPPPPPTLNLSIHQPF